MPYGKLNIEKVREELKELRRERAKAIRQAIGPERAHQLDDMMGRPWSERTPIIVEDFPIDLVFPVMRIREEMGDIEGLARSIAEVGQLQAIRLMPNGHLVFGERRWRAMRHLGRVTIRAEIMPTEDWRGEEEAENVERKNLTPEEKYYAVLSRLPRFQAEAKERQREAGYLVGSGQQSSAIVAEASKGEALRLACKGISNATDFRRTGQVLEAAHREPDKYEIYRVEMNEKGVGAAYSKFSRRRLQETMKNTPLPEGRFRTIVIDPPWPIEKRILGKGQEPAMPFPKMTVEEIEAKIRELLENNAEPSGCHVYLWTVHAFLPHAFEIFKELKDVGLTYASRTLTWQKVNAEGKTLGTNPQFSWMPVTEFVLFGRIGTLPLIRIGASTHFTGLRREHSRKPEEFYDLIEEVSPGPYLDAFSRGGHGSNKWIGWGDEAGRFDELDAGEPAEAAARQEQTADE